PTVEKIGKITRVTMDITEAEYDEFYLGYSNRVLWPVFHYRLDLAEFDTRFSETYRRMNRRFAETLSPFIEDGDVIWVHDYHLIPLAAELRNMGCGNRIGFFLHIPLPPPQIMVAIPDHLWLMRCLFSYDLVGFQTAGDATNFSRFVEEELGGTSDGGGNLTAFNRTIKAGHFPIGIDVDGFAALTHGRQAGQTIERLQARNLNRSQIIGVDRLDYSKGLPQRFHTFRQLLVAYPENRGQVMLMQISPPSREDVEAYADIRTELEQLSGAINGEFAEFDWTPIRYIHRHVARKSLAALFVASKVGLVTPLRDGMNLVAKEYVAAQDPEDPGVLVLSRFAGAAETMPEAVIINPYDTDQAAQALQNALRMPLEERLERHASLMTAIRETDVFHWRRAFLDALGRVPQSKAA
ncbi:MAG: trehalose-6-phosphate synthase, partial [Pseudomonadota bacterium]